MSDSTPIAHKKRKAPKTAWKPGQSGNPKGAAKRGQSWREIIDEIGEMTPDEARRISRELFSRVHLGNEVTLKQAVVMRVYAALLFDPQPGLLNAFMDRVEGKVTQPIEITWRQRVIELGLDPDQVLADVEHWLDERRSEEAAA